LLKFGRFPGSAAPRVSFVSTHLRGQVRTVCPHPVTRLIAGAG
jgi:hypothetical protein